MDTQETLAQFVRDALQHGAKKDDIRKALVTAQWEDRDIEGALNSYETTSFGVPVPRRVTIRSWRESLRYIVMFFTLGVSAVSTGAIGFFFIDQLTNAYDAYSMSYRYESMRGWLAALIVCLPLFIWLTVSAKKMLIRYPELRLHRARLGTTYLALTVASVVSIVTLIILISELLGDITLSFALKSVLTLLISGSIFGYYLSDLRSDEDVLEEKKSSSKKK